MANRRAKKVLCKVFAMVVSALVALALCSPLVQADEEDELLVSGGYVEGEVIAAFVTSEGSLSAQTDVPYKVTPLMEVGPASLRNASGEGLLAQSSDAVSLSLVTSDSLSTEELLRVLANDPGVAFAEPNYTYVLSEITASNKGLASQNDAPLSDLTPLQWGNWVTDTTIRPAAASGNSSINVPNFGSDQRGANMEKQVVVALIDTAVDYTHPDLTNVIYRFTPEQQAALGCGEWGFNATNKGSNPTTFDEGSVDFGHGTHTAGIIGAEWNGFGTSGVASDVKIVAIELADSNGVESLADALCAFDFVNRFNEQASEAERIKVTSNSWSEFMSSRALDAAVREIGERWGTVSFFSSGNDAKNNDYYEKTPSSLADNPYAIIVANTAQNDTLSDTSEYGRATVDLAAPGTAILSTTVPSRGLYYPDASRSSNLLYLGFDGESEPSVTVSQLYGKGEGDKAPMLVDDTVAREDIGAVVSDVHFYGSSCLKIELDPQYVVYSEDLGICSEHYDWQLDIDLTGTDIPDQLDGRGGLLFGFAASGEPDSSCVFRDVSTNATIITLKEPDENGGVAEVTRPVLSLPTSGAVCSGIEWGVMNYDITHESRANKVYNEEADLDVLASRVEDGHLIIKMRAAIPADRTTIYLDSLGIGTQVASYEFATGTSMSTPAVAGAAAVLASRGYEGVELASLVRSMVRIPKTGALAVKSGGVFDFTVEGSPDGDDEAGALAPVIMGVSVDGATVTVTGSNFGSAPGKVELSRYVVATDRTPVSATITSWADDRVTLELDSDFKGILSVVLSNAAGKYDTRFHFVDRGESVYEQDLPFDASTGDVFVYGDGQGDWETKGPLVGLGCRLYYLPAYEGKSDGGAGYRRILCFDLKTRQWSKLAELPEWLADTSAVMYDGKIVVEGLTMKELDSGEPAVDPYGESAAERVYVYDPATDAWTQASAEGMYPGQTILNDGGQLKLAGGQKPDPDHPDQSWMTLPVPVTAYDLDSGAGEELCELPMAMNNPSAATKDGTILLYNVLGQNPSLTRVQGSQATKLEYALPKFFLAEEGEPEIMAWGAAMGYPNRAVLAPTADGFVLVGPPAADGSSDTYVLRDGSDVCEPYKLRSSEDRVYAPAACTYRGRLFVIGSAWFEPEQRIFRATAMDVPEYPGDIPCEKDEPTPEPEPKPTPTPSPTPAPTPTSTSASTPTSRLVTKLPKTGDPGVPTPALIGFGACGIASVVAGIVLRKRKS